ncbi:MarR family winged helix-turn-helix transcriptional regulator [Amycolatopsis cihanbeyliensis]|uniref:DNA-binding MarR family transcriptional regulator n=1 Tax=Amycolatopsis cihanbeyliensis TaxID=1128664 RepID=A0A542DQZ7_AMYCI|nr:MarR family transcriptional regulator [Amycolatopsis cihanbeyliensis]TQJ05487.1 DNA-binding MarR family transcriptional regulator [Amycolatopsis cihanbeyliensis]
MTPPVEPRPELLGTRLRHLLEVLDSGIAEVDAELGLVGFRPRFAPMIRALAAAGPLPIRELAEEVGVTHSAASQTVAQLVKQDLVTLSPGTDARQRIAELTPRARRLLPVLEEEWAAATKAAEALDAELPYPLSRLIEEALRALRRQPMRERVAAAAPELMARRRARD